MVIINGGGKEVPLEVDPGITLDNLKKKFFEELRKRNWIVKNTPQDKLKMSYGSKRLKDLNQTLKDLGVEEGDRIVINVSYIAA